MAERIGRYELGDELGQGGFGVVYRAFDPREGRAIALKLLSKSRVGDANLVARFQREARIAGELDHRNLLRVFDLDQHDGRPFLVMELLDGFDLDERQETLPLLTMAQKLEIVRQTAEGLEAAHARGIVHRDLKPSNIRVTASGTVKVMDFGVAHLPGSMLTGTGDVLGTPAYMAPEQLRGGRVDPRADLYSLGVILYQLACGELPFHADSFGALVYKILNDPPRPLGELAEGDHAWLVPVIFRLLERDPEQRLPSARALLDALGEHPLAAACFLGEVGSAVTRVQLSAVPPAADDSPMVALTVHTPVGRATVQAPFEAIETTSSSVAATRMVVQDALVGRILEGRYQVEQGIGQGGMGKVFLAFDSRVLRQVVLKVPHAHLFSQPGFGERFVREIRVQIALEHPHIVHVLDSGEFDGLPFAVLQYLAGGTLQDRLLADAAQREPEPVLSWLWRVSEALDFIHAQGYVHRDVKPANLLFDRCGNAKLSDFGIVRNAAAEDGLTQLGSALGSPLYMAPESGREPVLRPPSDQYALAVTVFEALTGNHPHTGTDALALLASKMTEPPRPIRKYRPDLPEAIEAAILRALARDPAERFPSCTEFTRAFAAGQVRVATGGAFPLGGRAGTQPPAQARTEMVFQPLYGSAYRPPQPGDVQIRPALAGEEHRIDLAAYVLENGVDGLVRGAGAPARIVLDLNPTLDDLFAATLTAELLAGRELPPLSQLYATYTYLAREGNDPPAEVPLPVSVEGIFLALRNDGDGDLRNPATARRFVTRWGQVSAILLAAMAQGRDPFKVALFEDIPEFARERSYLVKDQLLYGEDVRRGERWVVHVPGGPADAPGLCLRQPESLLFKYWSRRDERARRDGTPYYFLAAEIGGGRWIFSLAPYRRVSLKPLAEWLQAAESELNPGRAGADPWYDGVRHRHTIVDAPRGGTALAPDRVLEIVRNWTRAKLVA